MKLTSCSSLFLLSLSISNASILAVWDASDYTSGDWTASTGGQVLNEENGTTVKVTRSFTGGDYNSVNYDAISFNGAADFLSATANPISGLSEYSISVVYSFADPATAASGASSNVNEFFGYNGLLGFDIPGVGLGEFGIGAYAGGSGAEVGAGNGLNDLDRGITAGSVVSGLQVLTYTVTNNNNGTYNHATYVNGSLVQDLGIFYNGSTTTPNNAFHVGSIVGAGTFFEGDIALIRFDSAPLESTEISALHSDYLGVVPEPAAFSFALGLCALFCIGSRKR